GLSGNSRPPPSPGPRSTPRRCSATWTPAPLTFGGCMHKTLLRLAGAVSLSLLASCASSPAVRTEIVEVPVEVQVPLDPALTRDVPPPPAPPRDCTDPAAGLPTLCTDALPDWI